MSCWHCTALPSWQTITAITAAQKSLVQGPGTISKSRQLLVPIT